MKELSGEHILLRIFIGESDKQDGKPAYQALVEMLRHEKIRGATVLRGIVGYGAHSHPHTMNILRLSQDLPIIIEVVDSQENIDRVMPQIERIASSGLITMEKVRVLRYGQ
ncbi:MAG: DUF190 domain-containing protein [Dehalococcoidia bacterium]|jgi:PII-like signaling protein|nr:MAG: DUF190 domain-containing protein [Dehalococcoidia bacterium]